MRIPRILLRILPALLFAPAAAFAGERPEVKVRFVLAEPTYRQEFKPAEISSLESAMAFYLQKRLADEIGFLRFSASAASPYALTFRLGDPAAPDSFHEVRFHISVSGPDGAGSIQWLFRDRDAWGTNIGKPLQFQTEIRSQLAKRAFRDLVPDLFSLIPIAKEQGDLIRDPVLDIAWILPFRQADLCMDLLDSQVNLAAEVSSSLGIFTERFRAAAKMLYNPPGAPDELRNRIVCVSTGGQNLDILRRSEPGTVKVKQIFVVNYRRMAAGCGVPAPPSAVAGSFGGGR